MSPAALFSAYTLPSVPVTKLRNPEVAAITLANAIMLLYWEPRAGDHEELRAELVSRIEAFRCA